MVDRELIDATAASAERLGFDSVWVTDHIVAPLSESDRYGAITEALITLGYVAAKTSSIAVGVSALVVPQREPVLTLKQLASLDFLAGGRLLLALGVGWLKGEFELLGASFANRGARTTAWCMALRDLAGAGGQAETSGLGTGRFRLDPPFAADFVDRVWVAGSPSGRTFGRAAMFGTWHPRPMAARDLEAAVTTFRTHRQDVRTIMRVNVSFEQAASRKFGEVVEGSPARVIAKLRRLQRSGADGFVIRLLAVGGDPLEGLETFSREVLPALRDSHAIQVRHERGALVTEAEMPPVG